MKKIIVFNLFFIAMLVTLVVSCNQSEGPVIREDLIVDDSKDSEDPITMISKDTLRIPVVHHISRNNSGGNAATNSQRVAKIMRDVNSNFKSSKIQFFTRAIKFVNNSQWNAQFVKQDDFTTSKVLASFEDETALNIFYFENLANRRNGQITGSLGATALFPNQGNNLKLSASAFSVENTATTTHEIGHYLGLYHTDDDFRDSQGRIELVDGSNCSEAGDKICDTPASPDLNDSNIDEPTCNYVGTETDPVGVPYNPDTLNFMTQWAGTDSDGSLCRRRFSAGQVEKMIAVLENERSYLITKE
jgi:predicted Zn-dependent protease